MGDVAVRSEHEESPKPAPAETARDTAGRILLIEDDDEMRSFLAEILGASGFQVTECADGRRWLEFCKGRGLFPGDEPACDVIVSDVRLPGMNGLEILAGLRRWHRPPPVILVTAFGDKELHAMARMLGAAAVLNKPFAVATLIKEIRRVLSAPSSDGAGEAPV